MEKIVSRNQELKYSEAAKFEESLNETMKKIRNIVTHDFLVVIISDFQRYSPDVIKYITQTSLHNDVLLAKVTDPLERDIPDTKFIAGDLQNQITVEGTSKKLRKRFLDGYDSDYQSFQNKMKKHRIPLFTINTTEPLEQQIKDIFKGKRK
jgi:uncharacterized protein (DUF58 family)